MVLLMHIDLNCDLGELTGEAGRALDEAMLQIVTSANVACGFHAGDPGSIARTLRSAARYGVSVGAHVSYADFENFGRRDMRVSPHDLGALVVYQLGAMQRLAEAAGTRIGYVKAHGALYNTIAHDEAQAAAVIDALLSVDPELPLVCLAGAPIVERAGSAGLRVISEAFADRSYEPDGSLTERARPGAVLHEPEIIAERMLGLVATGSLRAVDGTELQLSAESICVHGDTDGAIEIAGTLRNRLLDADIELRSFVG